MNHWIVWILVAGWILSAWYLKYMTKYENERSFIGSIEPKLMFIIMTAILIVAIIKV